MFSLSLSSRGTEAYLLVLLFRAVTQMDFWVRGRLSKQYID